MNPLQKKLFGSLGISLVILAFFVWLAVLPLAEKIKQLSQEYLTNRETLAKLDQREFLFKDLERNYQERQGQLSVIKGTFLAQEETVGFISTLEEIAEKTGNIFEIKTAKSFTSSSGENGETFLSLRISLWGDFESLLLFLANLEDSPYPPYRLLEIDSLSISRLSGENIDKISSRLREGDLETVLGIKIYTR
jgi:hypothetical protein